MYTVQTVAPINDVVALEQFKRFATIDINDDDIEIQLEIQGATEKVEAHLNRQLINATFETYTEHFIQDMILPKGKIQSLVKIEYMDEDGNYQTLSDTEYYLYGEYDRHRIHFESTPSIKDDKRAVKITYIAGYGENQGDVPKIIVNWIMLRAKDRYDIKDTNSFSTVTKIKDRDINDLNIYRLQPL